MKVPQTVAHVAGPIVADVQRCARCSTVLKDLRSALDRPDGQLAPWPLGMGVVYPEGAEVVVGPLFQALALVPMGEPCRAFTVRVTVTSDELLAEGRY